MRKRRTIYHNDARHNYLWLFEPPISMDQAWAPVDEVAGTAVDTLSYCVERGDGAFWPTKVGVRFGADMQPFTSQITWRAWECMQSLLDRGLDPLQVVIDRAHDKGLDFIADLRLSTYGGMDPAHKIGEGGRGWGHEAVREHQYAVVDELARDYALDGFELDYTAAFDTSNRFYFRAEDLAEGTAAMTDWVRRVAVRVRGQMPLGARINPTEAANLDQGLDVRTWLEEGLLDFVIPVLYNYTELDPNMPFRWVVEPANQAEASVYGFLQHYVRSELTGAAQKEYPSAAMFRAAAANYWDWGVDGLCTYMLDWPLGTEERAMLSEWGDPGQIAGCDKHYVFARCSEAAVALDYAHPLPCELAVGAEGCDVPFYLADDLVAMADRLAGVRLRLYCSNIVSADRLAVSLNGCSLAGEVCRRVRKSERDGFPHSGPRNFWLDFQLEEIRPVKGDNVLGVAMEGRPEGLGGSVALQEVELIIKYSDYPPGLSK